MASFFETPGASPSGATAPSFFESSTPAAPPVGINPLANYDFSSGKSVLGFLHNAWSETVGIGLGLTGLMKMGIQDAWHLGADLVGMSDPLQPYNLEQVASALPGALTHEYAQRYGSPSKIIEGFYDNPIAYIGDALMVAGGVSAIAKAGRVGGILGDLPTLVKDATAVKILGGPAETGFRGVAEYGSTALSGTATEAFKLSQNPLSRLIQKGVYNLASWSATGDRATRFLTSFPEGSAAFVRADETIGAAAENGMRVLQPAFGNFVSHHWVSKGLSWMRANVRDLTNTAIAEAKKPFEIFTAGKERDAAQVAAFEYQMGTATPLTRADASPVMIPTTRVPLLSPGDDLPIISSSAEHPETSRLLLDRFGRDAVPVGGNTLVTPHGGVGSDALDTQTVLLDSWNQAEDVGLEAMKAVGAEPTYVLDYASSDTVVHYDGYFMFGRRADGSVVQISLAPREAFLAQREASFYLPKVAEADQAVADTLAAIPDTQDEIIRQMTGTGAVGGTADTAPRINSAEVVARTLDTTTPGLGGASLDPTTGVFREAGQEGYGVASQASVETVSASLPPQEIQAAIERFAADNAAALSAPGAHLGTWNDGTDIHLDVSTVLDSREAALQMGDSLGQKAIYDFKAGEDIPVPPTASIETLDQADVDHLGLVAEGKLAEAQGHAPMDFETLKQSIKNKGILEPVVVEYNAETGGMLFRDGFHRFKAAKQLGLKRVPVKWIDEAGNEIAGPAEAAVRAAYDDAPVMAEIKVASGADTPLPPEPPMTPALEASTKFKEEMLAAQAAHQEAVMERLAADYFMRDELFAGHRRAWWSENPEAAPARFAGDTREYDPVLRASDQSSIIRSREVTKRWMRDNDGTFMQYMDRAYYPQRQIQFAALKSQMKPVFEQIMAMTGPKGGAVRLTTKYAAVLKALKAFGIEDPSVLEILGAVKLTGNKAASVQRLMDKVDSALGPLLVEEGGRAIEFGGEAAKSFDWRMMHEQRLADHLPTAGYVPHVTLKPGEIMTSPVPRGTHAVAADATKQYRGIMLERGTVLQDPVAASTIAAQQMINYQEASAFMDRMIASGIPRQLTAGELAAIEANPTLLAGEKLWAPGVIKQQMRARGNFLGDVATDVGEAGSDAAVASAITRFEESGSLDILNEVASSPVYAVPKGAAAVMEREVKLILGDNFRMFWDTPQNLWKQSVLSMNPRWVVNNTAGNSIFLGIENPGALRYMLSQFGRNREALTRLLIPEDPLRVVESGFIHNVIEHPSMSLAEGEAAGVGRGVLGSNLMTKARETFLTPKVGGATDWVVGKIKWWSEWVRNLNGRVEEATRRAVYIDAARKEVLTGWIGGIHSDIQVMEELLRRGETTAYEMDKVITAADVALGNFVQYSPVEQAIIRRFLMPFYGFYRHSVKVMIKLPFAHPLKGRVLGLLNEMGAGMDPTLPDYMREYVPLGALGGTQFALNVHSLNPLSQITEELPVVGALNPVVKLLLERQLGVSAYTGQAFDNPEDVVGPYGGKYYQIQRGSNGEYLGVVPTGHPLPSLFSHVLSQFPQFQLLPGVSLYPKSNWLKLVNMAGLPLKTPDFATSSQYFLEDLQRATTAGANVVSPPAPAAAGTSFFEGAAA